MGVEACYQTNETAMLGSTAAGFRMPPVDAATPVEVPVSGWPTNWQPGSRINMRPSLGPDTPESNVRLVVLDYDAASGVLSLVHSGASGSPAPGEWVSGARAIYLDEPGQSTWVKITNNYFKGTLPIGGVAFHGQSAVVCQAGGFIEGNFIQDWGVGVLARAEQYTPSYPAAAGLRIRENIIMTRDAERFSNVTTYGIQCFGGDEQIRENYVACRVSWKTIGIALRGGHSSVLNNVVLSDRIRRNGYWSAERSVGVGVGNTGWSLRADSNQTAGFDVGVGPIGANQWIPFHVRDHRSRGDQLPVDPVGLTAW
jgi:hypothetical protein